VVLGLAEYCIKNQYSAMAAPALSTLGSTPELVLPQHVWRGRELAQAPERVLPTGHAALDAELPGEGWPLGCLIEVLQAQPQQHVWQLLAPALAQCMQAQPGPVVLVNAPYEPFAPGLQAQGIQPSQLLCVKTEKASARLWAAEQALRCADVSAVLAGLPVAKSEELRRLHLCAQQHDKWLVAFRRVEAGQHASPARLRLLVEGVEQMEVRILKRRGPPLLQPLLLDALPPRLAALLAPRKARRGLPFALPSFTGGSHVLDRTASFTE
jgi:protein ImuA